MTRHFFAPSLLASALLLTSLSAQAEMAADDFQKAQDAAHMIARKSAQYELCGVSNATDLRKALLGFGSRCGANEAELGKVSKAYDAKRAEQMKALVNGNYVCPVQPAQAREMIERDLVAMGSVDCKPTTGKLQLK
jgi:hypothetical protein